MHILSCLISVVIDIKHLYINADGNGGDNNDDIDDANIHDKIASIKVICGSNYDVNHEQIQ